MNPRIFVGVIVGALAIVIGIIAFSGSSIINDVSEDGFLFGPSGGQAEILPVEIELEDLTILDITENVSTLQIKFKISNPNHKAVILQIISYQLYEDDIRITGGQIGTRAEGMVSASNYYTILNGYPTVLTDKITITNSGDMPEFWSALTSNDTNWRITGDAYFNLSSLTSGGENSASFEFFH